MLLTLACAALGLAPLPATAQDSVTWTLHPHPAGAGALSTTMDAHRMGVRTFPAERLDRPVDTVSARYEHAPGTTVDVRGQRADGGWTEWLPVPGGGRATLPEATTAVQARLVRAATGTADDVRRIELTAWRAAAGPQADSPGGSPASAQSAQRVPTFRIFATREGLVGHTTANGHKITRRDHFVALPSRRGLSGRGSGEYTVRVCTTDNARCEWAPVWDVGPWNVRDDHWNPGREHWPDLPHGRPQAEAAYQDGHNGGRDGFGREVRNPAGIDLADGTFWDGLRLKTNAWVNVTYEWARRGPWGTVVTPRGVHLNVRRGTSAGTQQVGFAARHARVRIVCSLRGAVANGTQGSTDVWYRLAPGKHVSAAYVDRPEGAPAPRPC
ncbi:hypothetical protein B0I33_109237 [Prauserella shujinwangii]|uniref:Secreted protein n=1 Tax=Prauserella shujinwangii TaxID=1453103 RepID=A0A2T0LQH3_9PSEU|nr:hypothetical protein B0I33_109237 [Prauserella shujinwangii]